MRASIQRDQLQPHKPEHRFLTGQARERATELMRRLGRLGDSRCCGLPWVSILCDFLRDMVSSCVRDSHHFYCFDLKDSWRKARSGDVDGRCEPLYDRYIVKITR